MKNNKLLLLSLLFLGVFSSATYWIGFYSNGNREKTYNSNWQNIEFLLDHLMENYVDSIDRNELTQKSITNLLKELDPHSTYIPSSKRVSINEPLVGHFGGIGIRFMILRDTLTVVDVISGGPSYISGLQKRDRIIKIDNQNVAGVGLTNQMVLKKLKGEVGSEVSLGILKPNKTKLSKVLKRGLIPLKSIAAATMIKKDVGYIKLSTFSNSTDIEFKNALSNLIENGMQKLILDLRFNGGGYLHQAINVADEFLEKNKLIVYTNGAHSIKRTFYATNKGLFEKGELVLLVNSGTASASEIVSGAIQDHKRGLIIGRRTFGKGLVQQPVLLPDSSELRITTSRYYTPSGKCIQKPYGDSIDYDNDIIERLENGELTYNDTITNKKFNEGGILPDIFSSIDTLEYLQVVSKISFTRNWRDFCFDYYEKNPVRPFEKLKDFYQDFTVQQSVFKTYFIENKIDLKDLNNQVLKDLKWSLMLELCSYYYDDQARYILNSFKDKDVGKALIELE